MLLCVDMLVMSLMARRLGKLDEAAISVSQARKANESLKDSMEKSHLRNKTV